MTYNHMVVWSEEDKHRLRRYKNSGYSWDQIADRLDRTVVAVKVAHKAFFPAQSRQNKWQPEDDERLLQLHKDGLSCSKIGKILDRSRNSVIGRICRLRDKLGTDAVPSPGKNSVVKRAAAVRKAKAKARKDRAQQAKAKPNNVVKFELRDDASRMATVGRPLSAIPENGCRYTVVTDDELQTHLMCGAPGHPWCETHRSMVFRPISAETRKDRAIVPIFDPRLQNAAEPRRQS